MTWTNYHNRGELLRTMMAVADERRDGLLPMDVDGVSEKFADELDVIGALQLRWHTRLSGLIEERLSDQPMDLENKVIEAWHQAAHEMPGVLAILDHYRAEPLDEEMARAMRKAHAKEHLLLAVMAGRGSANDEAAIPVGAQIEARARETYRPLQVVGGHRRTTLLDRLRELIAA